jgi:hypothetical protein
MEDRWEKVRLIVREECERIEKRILESLKNTGKLKIKFENGRWVGVTEEQIEAWNAAYPAVDVEQQLKLAAAWIMSNPTQAPKSNYPRFLNTWLTRQQNQASLRSIPTGPRPTERKQKLCAYCDRPNTGSVNGIWHCDEHSRDAMDMRPRRMLGVVAKPVAGRD